MTLRALGPDNRGRRLYAVAMIAGLVAACSSGATPSPQPTAASQSAPAPTPSNSLDARSGLVDIGGGRNLYVDCAGSGSPTILLESGDESDVNQWRLVYPSLVKQTRTCQYDRFGNGQSDPATGCRELKDLRGDLEALLNALGEHGPYELVGTSGGGYLMAGFAYAHPKDVVGLVLVETPHAIIASESPKELLAELNCHSSLNQEHRDYVKVENDVWSHRHRIGDIPMTVISNDYGTDYQNAEERTNVAGQKGWLVLSPRARQVVVHSGHDVPGNEPDLTTREILRVLDAARAG